MPKWPNAERTVVAWLAPVGVPVYTEPASSMPDEYLTVERVGGSGAELDRIQAVEVAVTARTRARMWELVDAVETRMDDLMCATSGGVYVDDVLLTFGFAHDPPPSQDARRAIGAYTLTVRPVG